MLYEWVYMFPGKLDYLIQFAFKLVYKLDTLCQTRINGFLFVNI